MLNNLLLRLGFRGHDGKAKPGNLDENGNLKVTLSGKFVRLSTEQKPTGKEGDTLLLYDTKQVFVHDGAEWREF